MPAASRNQTFHVIAFDDAPFAATHRGDVPVVGVVYCGTRLDGVLRLKVRRDGANATRNLARAVRAARFHPQLHAVLLQGIAMAGFNVIDIRALAAAVRLPVIVVSRHRPDLPAIRAALLRHVRGGARKWRLIERLAPMEQLAGLYVQRAAISAQRAEALLRACTVHGRLPEPLRAAHMIAAAMTAGASRHRP